jgi:hypothetical protein
MDWVVSDLKIRHLYTWKKPSRHLTCCSRSAARPRQQWIPLLTLLMKAMTKVIRNTQLCPLKRVLTISRSAPPAKKIKIAYPKSGASKQVKGKNGVSYTGVRKGKLRGTMLMPVDIFIEVHQLRMPLKKLVHARVRSIDICTLTPTGYASLVPHLEASPKSADMPAVETNVDRCSEEYSRLSRLPP